MEGGSASTLSNDDNLVVSSEDSSSPTENGLELRLTLSLGRKGFRDCRATHANDDSSSSSSSSPSSLSSRASVTAGIKRTADSMAPPTSGFNLYYVDDFECIFLILEESCLDLSMVHVQVVGWPPIRTYRMNSMVNQAKTLAMEDPQQVNRNTNDATKMGSSMFVKVTMDGIPIGRKVDLNAHNCYESLSNALEDMFLKPNTVSSTQETDGHLETRLKILPDGSSGLVLTYEDKEGDWMLVGDVPWRMFIGSVKRLRIMKTSEATGAAKMNL
ncbi:hypothetical protein IGI04_000816 [Brassica rapa subsp. trilocularis]|uniref:Auxin-responsive protein n=1 Tax=Brassica rapa subsp. trilocularis TaxID=1813537 RepID=A0ABQ7NQZ6_BRACM|nr:hypothetical protein IGI04_000816 [Brassica rapa subsp. trilocularis]